MQKTLTKTLLTYLLLCIGNIALGQQFFEFADGEQFLSPFATFNHKRSKREPLGPTQKRKDFMGLAEDEALLAIINSNVDGFTAHFVLHINSEERVIGAILKYIDPDDSRRNKYFPFSRFNNLIKLKVVRNGTKVYPVVLLKSNEFQQYGKTSFTLDYLVNGITSKRKEISLTLDYTGNSWGLYHNGRKIKKMYFVKKTILMKIIGIKKIHFTYQTPINL